MANKGLEASDMLAEALKQLDNVLASTKFDYHHPHHHHHHRHHHHKSDSDVSHKPRPSPVSSHQHQRLIQQMEELKTSLEDCHEKSEVMTQVPQEVMSYLQGCIFSGHDSLQSNGYHSSDGLDDRIHRLETDKQSLSLQVSVLTEQVEAQSEKIRELEYTLDERRQRLMQAEDMLQSELLTRTSLETHKLDLMAEISSLKLKLASSDKDRRDLDERLRHTQRQFKELESKLALKEAEITELRQRLVRNGTVVTPDANGSFDNCDRPIEKEKTLDRLKRKPFRRRLLPWEYEVEKLKKAVDSLMLSNHEKDKRIDELRRLLKRYRKIEELVVQAQGRKALEDMMLNAEDDTSSTSSTTPSLSEGTPKDQVDGRGDNLHPNASPDNGGYYPSMSSTPKRSIDGIQRSNSAEDLSANPKKKPVTNNNIKEAFSSNKNGSYAHTETVTTDDEDGLQQGSMASPTEMKKRKGLRRFLGKLKRSGSQDFHERERSEQFRRGGVRATATARLGVKYNDETPFQRWDSERVTAWMNDIGLNMYLVECRRWVKNGEQLLRATQHDLEKDMGIKNSLHRKKLQLSLQSVSANSKDTLNVLDHNWVTRWLDDIGLPQYKDNFYDARVDGRMLHFLTVDDLLSLKVVNELHHISIKRGIQVLRANNYNPQCLRRRPSPDEGPLQDMPVSVALWTNHRVMEWLRTINLSEYAPNLRGSGVHGALMVLEPRFNAELFSQLLSIPTNKTLIRRHLSTNFVALIGNDTQFKKREHESLPGYVPLLPNAKVKSRKFGLFGHKRSKSDADSDSFICPMNGMSKEEREKSEKTAKEIGIYSKEINSLTDMLASDNFMKSVPTSNV